MPPRSNLFQDVVAIVERFMAGDAAVEESAMLRSRSTGDLREVDVVVTGRVGSYEMKVGIEASKTSRRRSIEWVEQLACKHDDLGTDKLILVSSAGVTPAAQRLAEARGATVITASDLDAEDNSWNVVNKLQSIWPRSISIKFNYCDVRAQAPDSLSVLTGAPDDLDVVTSSGQSIGTLAYVLQGIVEDNWPLVIRQIAAFGIEQSAVRNLEMRVEHPQMIVGGTRGPACLRFIADSGPAQSHPILSLDAKAECAITVEHVSLEHMRLGQVGVAYGQAQTGNSSTTFVATATGDAEALFLRTRAPGQAPQTVQLIAFPESDKPSY